ncbi:MAG TPA: malto-oligosyltrehalose synthase [Opitutaceae bacterium]|nr:malto-oligosyltrehalose synthase [Opitutaceae bacterium]
MSLAEAQHVPRATYRLQLHAGFTFADVEKLVPYLERLGVSDCYFSPIFLSTPESTHGYDVSDYRKVDPKLGGERGLRQVAAALHERGMSVLLDFVPNHMSVSGPLNPWWQDVLEGGSRSPYARFFDIHWNQHHARTAARILLPVLEDAYGIVLEQGKLKLDYSKGRFLVRYGTLQFPLRPLSYPALLEAIAGLPAVAGEEQKTLQAFATEYRELTAHDAVLTQEEAMGRSMRLRDLQKRMAGFTDRHPHVTDRLSQHLAVLNGREGDPASFAALDELLDAQHYRLAHWRTGAHETNYRRFFAIDTLIGLRMESPEVFHETHLLLGMLLNEGLVQGLRIDHIDGLWDPIEYLERLKVLAQEPGKKPCYVVVEKILEGRERLPEAWPVHGTTGYEFPAQLAGLFTEAANETRFTDIYRAFTADETDYDKLVYEKKRWVLDEMFANAVSNLGAELADMLRGDRRWRDLTRHGLTVAIREIIAALDVYRTYRRLDGKASPGDAETIFRAYDHARRRNATLEGTPFELVRNLLVGDYPPASADQETRERFARWALTFQQYTGAVMAKSVEDTAFYVYNRLIALNEVGGDPARFGSTVEEFHHANAGRLAFAPHSLLATSTHDTKLSEDVRARLYPLSELIDDWERWLSEWRGLNAQHKTRIDGRLAPDENEEYRLYQVLLGAWPLTGDVPDDALIARLREHWRKAESEAKRNTSWTHSNDRWLDAGERFLKAILHPASGREFLENFQPRAARIAHLGMVNSLAQTVLKITSPGVPDIYQGNETWDFSLVDPDNRRPVDYERRLALEQSVASRSPRELLRDWRDGGIKLHLVRKLLNFRREHPLLFAEGDYVPLGASGRFARHVVAFARSHASGRIIVVVPRLTALLGCPPTGLIWDDTAVAYDSQQPWEDLLTGRTFAPGSCLPVSELLHELPVAVLRR